MSPSTPPASRQRRRCLGADAAAVAAAAGAWPALRSLHSPVDTEWGALMAGTAIATLPLLVLLARSSRQLIAGLTAGAVK